MFSVVPSKVAGDVFTEAMYDTYVRDNINRGVMRPVAGAVLTADAPSFTFGGISSEDFFGLLALVESRSTAPGTSTNWLMRFNGDTGANYWYTRTFARNATVSVASNSTADNSIIGLNIPAAGSPAGVLGAHLIHFPRLVASGQQRWCGWLAGSKGANVTNSAFVGVNFARWTNTTDDVTSITFAPAAGDFAAGSKFHLYGVGAI